MLQSINKLHNFTLHATDGVIGALQDSYFDDLHWVIRYLVASTGDSPFERQVLISPVSVQVVDWFAKTVLVGLTCEQVRKSPDSGAAKPVSRQQEEELGAYYGWPPYWPVVPAGMEAIATPPVALDTPRRTVPGDPHLRSAHELKGYPLEARDGPIGHVSDFVFDDQAWEIVFMIVDAGTWLHKRQALVKPAWIEDISWEERHVAVRLTREAVRTSPVFSPHFPLPAEYIEQLTKHYHETE